MTVPQQAMIGTIKKPAIAPLSKILKLDESSLYDPVEFAKAKWAETYDGKKQYDVLYGCFWQRRKI